MERAEISIADRALDTPTNGTGAGSCGTESVILGPDRQWIGPPHEGPDPVRCEAPPGEPTPPRGFWERDPDGRVWLVQPQVVAGDERSSDGALASWKIRGVRRKRRCSRVAIMGFATTTRDMAPYEDQSCEIWGLNQLYRHIPRFDRWFEMHRPEQYLADQVEGTDYLAWLRRCPVPLVMIDTRVVRQAVPYPIEAAIRWAEKDYFQSSIAYMFVQAALEGYQEIHIYGVDLVVGAEYDFQKANLEYLIGVALGKGLTVNIPRASALLKQRYRYGYELLPDTPIPAAMIRTLLAGYAEKKNELISKTQSIDGAIQQAEHMLHLVTCWENGAEVVYKHPGGPPPAYTLEDEVASTAIAPAPAVTEEAS